jgi:hypothetical protein
VSSQLSLFTTDRPAPPRRGEPLNVQARRTGFQTSRPRARGQSVRVLALLAEAGPLTDHQISEALELALATVNSLRGGLVRRGFVRAWDYVPGLSGAQRTRWRLETPDDVF